MDINRANMQALFTGYNRIFLDAFQSYVDTTYAQFVGEVNAGTSQIDMPMLEQLTGMREWVDVREIKNLKSDKLTIKARFFEDTVAVKREDVEDDQYGLYNSLFQTMAQNAANLPNDITNELLAAAASAKWMDGAAFFGTTRKYGKETINNKGTSALTYDSFNTAYDAMRAYKGHGGKSLGVKPNLLLHGPSLRTTVADVIKAPIRAVTVGDAAVTMPNPNANLVTPIEVDGITNSDWFLLDARKPFKPIIMFMRKRPNRLIRLDREEDENVFMNRQFIYGTDGRAEVAFAMPHLIYYSDVA
ncbi:MAG: Mu-like prophage major head subunit gpT family protein [Lentisphaeria bacterium]|jgi:phage major head subunit gpT-like protein